MSGVLTLDHDEREVRSREKPRPPILIVDGLTVTYGEPGQHPPAVRDASFQIAEGERFALVGELGSGKTTLALALAGFLGSGVHVGARELCFYGMPLGGRRAGRLPTKIPGITMVFQDAMTSLDPLWTIGSQIGAVLRRIEGTSRRELPDRIRYWLNRVGLHDFERVTSARPYELSGGMRQRVMLAIAIASRPRLLIADEPTSALDASVARDVMDLLVELTDSAGASLLIVSHDLHLCQAYADRILVMLNGRIVEQLPASDLEHRACHDYTKGLLRCAPTLGSYRTERLPTLSYGAA